MIGTHINIVEFQSICDIFILDLLNCLKLDVFTSEVFCGVRK